MFTPKKFHGPKQPPESKPHWNRQSISPWHHGTRKEQLPTTPVVMVGGRWWNHPPFQGGVSAVVQAVRKTCLGTQIGDGFFLSWRWHPTELVLDFDFWKTKKNTKSKDKGINLGIWNIHFKERSCHLLLMDDLYQDVVGNGWKMVDSPNIQFLKWLLQVPDNKVRQTIHLWGDHAQVNLCWWLM